MKNITLEPTYKGRQLKDCTYAELKGFALYLKIDLKSLRYMNENYLIKAIKEAYKNAKKASYKLFVDDYDPECPKLKSDHMPFEKLENVSTTFRVNYAHHFGVPKEEIIEALGIKPKSYVDKVWLYDNGNYKNKILKFLEEQKSKS